MSIVNFVFIRHGESKWNKETPHLVGGRSNHTPLTIEGVEQAKQLGSSLKLLTAETIIFSSPAIRTTRTAEIACATLDPSPEVIIDDSLQELDQGEWTGHHRELVYSKDVIKIIDQQDIDFTPPQGESMRMVGQRMSTWLFTKAKIIDPKLTVVVFGHGHAIRCLVGIINGWSKDKILTTAVPHTSLTRIDVEGEHAHIRYIGRVNSTHLSSG